MSHAITRELIQRWLRDVEFGDWKFRVGGDFASARPFLQVTFSEPCMKTGVMKHWSGRKWFLSLYMCHSEVIQTAFKAALGAVEHEAREKFKYRGRPIFGPHYDVDKLWEIAVDEYEETRDPPQGV
jgi:hypothetical protein